MSNINNQAGLRNPLAQRQLGRPNVTVTPTADGGKQAQGTFEGRRGGQGTLNATRNADGSGKRDVFIKGANGGERQVNGVRNADGSGTRDASFKGPDGKTASTHIERAADGSLKGTATLPDGTTKEINGKQDVEAFKAQLRGLLGGAK